MKITDLIYKINLKDLNISYLNSQNMFFYRFTMIERTLKELPTPVRPQK